MSSSELSTEQVSMIKYDLMKVFNKKTKKKKTCREQRDFEFVWKGVNTSVGLVFEAQNTEPKSKRKTSDISKEEILKVLHLSQINACKSLNCTLSTLKRRFYELKQELGLQCWPQYFQQVSHLPIFHQIYPMSLSFILNKNDTNNKSTC